MRIRIIHVLIFLLGWLSLGAFYGSIPLILAPDGSMLGMDTAMLDNSIFQNYLVPGIILLVVFGLAPLFVIYGLIRRPRIRWPERLNLLCDHYWAWTFALYIGVGQVIWINIQTLILNRVDLLHTIYSSLGLLILCVGLLPQVRNMYRIPNKYG